VIDIEKAANTIIEQILPSIRVSIYEDSSKKTRPLVISFIVDGKERSYKRLSGGEKVVVNIGLRLGFSQVIMAKAQTQINFIILDEPFGPLDENSKELIKSVLATISKWFNQIIVISHDDSIRSFPNLIQIGKTDESTSYIM
jgi:DNA repair exonuclease SbcCD ATPase subunit